MNAKSYTALYYLTTMYSMHNNKDTARDAERDTEREKERPRETLS